MGTTKKNREFPSLSVIVPAFNEEDAIAETVQVIRQTMEAVGSEYEIIVVDDCSTDDTTTILETLHLPHFRVLRHDHNRGYGASLKTGIRAASCPYVAITDADGTYPNDRIPDLARLIGNGDMVVGARTGKNIRIPIVRRPAKWVIGKLANYLARFKIPDINSGLRVFKKDTLLKYIHILPDGFSFTTTITLSMLTCGDEVIYTPIDYAHRVGKSKIKPIRDTLNFIQLILRTILLFEPLRVFVPFSVFLFLGGVAVLSYSWFYLPKVMDMTTTLLFVSSLQILATGMLADMINRRLGR